jgi:hypothetical protein
MSDSERRRVRRIPILLRAAASVAEELAFFCEILMD